MTGIVCNVFIHNHAVGIETVCYLLTRVVVKYIE